MNKSIFISLFIVLAIATVAFAGSTIIDVDNLGSIQTTIPMRNNTSADVAAGSVVIYDTTKIDAGTLEFNSTTTASDVKTAGVVKNSITTGEIGLVITYGVADVIYDAGTCAVGTTVGTGTTAKKATGGNTGLGFALEAVTGTGSFKTFIKTGAPR